VISPQREGTKHQTCEVRSLLLLVLGRGISIHAWSSANIFPLEISILPSSFPPLSLHPSLHLFLRIHSLVLRKSPRLRALPCLDPTHSASRAPKTSRPTSLTAPNFPICPLLSALSSTFRWVGPKGSSGNSTSPSSASSRLERVLPPWSGARGRPGPVMSSRARSV
jgi:hypothetical protein